MDLTDLTAIHGAGRYLLRLMKAKRVTLAGGGIGIRALLDDSKALSSLAVIYRRPKAVVSLGDNSS